jgi:hypothetical protein
MHGTGSHISLKPRLHSLQNRTTIGVFIETEYLEKHSLLKRSEHVCHNGYIVGINPVLSTLLFAVLRTAVSDGGNVCRWWGMVLSGRVVASDSERHGR